MKQKYRRISAKGETQTGIADFCALYNFFARSLYNITILYMHMIFVTIKKSF